MARDNKSIGRFKLEGIPPAPRGVPQIEVTFDINADGILNVSAKDLGTGKEQKITIKSSSGLSEQDIQQMVKEAEAHADEDKKQRDIVETRNRADSMVYQTERQLQENGDKIPPELRGPVEDGIAELKKAIEADDTERMKTVMSEIEGNMHKFAEELYRNAQAQQQAAPDSEGPRAASSPDEQSDPGSPGKAADDGEVIDADFRMVDEDKKS